MRSYYREYLSDSLVESLYANVTPVDGVALLPFESGASDAADLGSFQVRSERTFVCPMLTCCSGRAERGRADCKERSSAV